jgi:hypothetical protein
LGPGETINALAMTLMACPVTPKYYAAIVWALCVVDGGIREGINAA